MHTEKLTTKCHICLQGGLMCGIWDWQSTIVKDLNDSQDPKHTLFCRENAFVAKFTLFFRQQMSAFYPFRGGSPKADIGCLFTGFLLRGLPLHRILNQLTYQAPQSLCRNESLTLPVPNTIT